MVQPITGQLWKSREESWQNKLGQGNLAIKTFAQLGKAGKAGPRYFAKVPGAILRRALKIGAFISIFPNQFKVLHVWYDILFPYLKIANNRKTYAGDIIKYTIWVCYTCSSRSITMYTSTIQFFLLVVFFCI